VEKHARKSERGADKKKLVAGFTTHGTNVTFLFISSKFQMTNIYYVYRFVTTNIIITILDIIHRPVVDLKPNSILFVCLYLAGKTLGLRY
jgi:hypothetical protein